MCDSVHGAFSDVGTLRRCVAVAAVDGGGGGGAAVGGAACWQ